MLAVRKFGWVILDAASLLAVGSFLLIVELLCLQLCSPAFSTSSRFLLVSLTSHGIRLSDFELNCEMD